MFLCQLTSCFISIFWAPLLVNKQCLPLVSYHIISTQQHEPQLGIAAILFPPLYAQHPVLLGDLRKHPRANTGPQGNSHGIPFPSTEQWELFPPPLFGGKMVLSLGSAAVKALQGNLSGITSTPGVSQQHSTWGKLHFAPLYQQHMCKSSPQGRCVLCSCNCSCMRRSR